MPKRTGDSESDSEDDDDSVDITKVSPIMKYISNKLVEHKYHLEMDGPFRYRSDIPGLSKHLFVAYKFVLMLEGAGYDNSKMYMSAMFPQGMADTILPGGSPARYSWNAGGCSAPHGTCCEAHRTRLLLLARPRV